MNKQKLTQRPLNFLRQKCSLVFVSNVDGSSKIFWKARNVTRLNFLSFALFSFISGQIRFEQDYEYFNKHFGSKNQVFLYVVLRYSSFKKNFHFVSLMAKIFFFMLKIFQFGYRSWRGVDFDHRLDRHMRITCQFAPRFCRLLPTLHTISHQQPTSSTG